MRQYWNILENSGTTKICQPTVWYIGLGFSSWLISLLPFLGFSDFLGSPCPFLGRSFIDRWCCRRRRCWSVLSWSLPLRLWSFPGSSGALGLGLGISMGLFFGFFAGLIINLAISIRGFLSLTWFLLIFNLGLIIGFALSCGFFGNLGRFSVFLLLLDWGRTGRRGSKGPLNAQETIWLALNSRRGAKVLGRFLGLNWKFGCLVAILHSFFWKLMVLARSGDVSGITVKNCYRNNGGLKTWRYWDNWTL